MKIHPSDFLLEEALLCPSDGPRPLLRHLTDCSRCRSRLDGLSHQRSRTSGLGQGLSLPGSLGCRRSGEELDYGLAIERSERKYLETAHYLRQERAEAPGIVADLLGHRPEKRQLLLANSSRLRTWGVYELLLERSWQLLTVNRTESEELAKLAIALSFQLDSTYYNPQMINDLRARAWSYVGNLRRIAMDLEAAEQGFQIAYAHLLKGTREPIERALFLDLKASLRSGQRRFDEAMRLLHRAIAIFLDHSDDHRAGKSLVSLAAMYSFAGQVAEAVPVLEQALALIDPMQDERLLLCAWHNLIDDLATLGRFIEAQGLYRRARTLYRKNKDRVLDLRRIWVKGRIERGLGQRESSESLFLAAREGFLAQDLPYEAALVSLELATLYAEQDRTAELKQLAAEVLAIFAARRIHREALAALMFLKQAIDAERLTIQTANGIADFLRRAAGDPVLTFEVPIARQ